MVQNLVVGVQAAPAVVGCLRRHLELVPVEIRQNFLLDLIGVVTGSAVAHESRGDSAGITDTALVASTGTGTATSRILEVLQRTDVRTLVATAWVRRRSVGVISTTGSVLYPWIVANSICSHVSRPLGFVGPAGGTDLALSGTHIPLHSGHG